jgi:hypothetical protein
MPEGFPMDGDLVRDALSYYADVLYDCGADVLAGDVTAFRELRRSVNAEYTRRTRAMKREEKAARARN